MKVFYNKHKQDELANRLRQTNRHTIRADYSEGSKLSNMDFKQFKKEWADVMVYKPADFDYEETMHELYIEYKESLNGYGGNMSVKKWCEFFHAECDLDQHPYMLIEKALQTHHGNGLKEMANRFRKSVGIPLFPLIPKP